MLEQELNTYWRTVVDTIQDAVMIVDTDGTIVTVNAAFADVTGYAIEEVVGQSCTILQCPTCNRERGQSDGHWCPLFRTGRVRRHRCTIRHRSGRDVPVLKNAAVLRDKNDQVLGGVETLTDISALVDRERQIEAFRRELSAQDGFEGIIGQSPAMQAVFAMIENAADSDAPVIIFGESGTGKELVARAIHHRGPRRAKPYVKVNCAALAETLLESELFGHVRGSFTGAVADKIGKFEQANQGTIFLDEIATMPLHLQTKLLRVLQEQELERVGSTKKIKLNVRVISATNANLEEEIEQGRFRNDLYYRLNVIPVHLPALRERREDIALLARHFLQKICEEMNRPIMSISPTAMRFLESYHWPGNVRELENVIERTVTLTDGIVIEKKDLPANITGSAAEEEEEPALTCPALTDAGVDLPQVVADLERQLIRSALELSAGVKARAADLLSIKRTTLVEKIKRLGIEE